MLLARPLSINGLQVCYERFHVLVGYIFAGIAQLIEAVLYFSLGGSISSCHNI